MIDIKPHDLKVVKLILERRVPGYEVWAFGSRVKGTARSYSDLDLVILSQERIPLRELCYIKEDFEESTIPFRVDVLDWSTVTDSFRNVIKECYEIIKKANE